MLNDSTFEEVGFIRLSRLNLISVGGTLVILSIALVYVSIAYTPIRETIPGYPNSEMRNNIVQNAILLDSLKEELRYRDQFFMNLNKIISGEAPQDYLNSPDDSTANYQYLSFTRSPADSILRQEIDLNDKLRIPVANNSQSNSSLEKMHFFTPVVGVITNPFNSLNSHFGTDVVAAPNEVVKATLDGTVIMASWTLETGYVIQLQHTNNLISVYKHNAELLKKVGMRVKAGDAIAIVGNSGELTTGPHLHFELWQNGVALNPENYIKF
ncbi:MAG: M23 family metallopeptidase [Bacteroidales bacterium]|nr:M23 family metallopeptidase [Bacteroidales bacterium]MCB8999215.1 M23 family metallopeptidase [Bacteroidales bacterium]